MFKKKDQVAFTSDITHEKNIKEKSTYMSENVREVHDKKGVWLRRTIDYCIDQRHEPRKFNGKVLKGKGMVMIYCSDQRQKTRKFNCNVLKRKGSRNGNCSCLNVSTLDCNDPTSSLIHARLINI